MVLLCPDNWEYADIAGHRGILKERCGSVLKRFSDATFSRSSLIDTRPVHAELYNGLTPIGFPAFAGHYRGNPICPCLSRYVVGVPNDERVGCPPAQVQYWMTKLSTEVESVLDALDAMMLLPASSLSAIERLKRVVAASSRFFELLLRIHPYANGNGHIARMFLVGLLRRYGYRIKGFPVFERPPSPYVAVIKAYRNGGIAALEGWIYDCILNAAQLQA